MMADDLGYGDTGFNGSTEINTPGLDHLASQGIIFNRFYSASPVCSPTRASCLTGRNPYRMGIPTANSGHLPSSELTLAEILKEEGYRTGHFGKWHLGTFTASIKDANRGRPGNTELISVPTQHGFDKFFSSESKVPTYDPMLKPENFDHEKGESLRFGWKARSASDSTVYYGTRYWTGIDQHVDDNLSGDDSALIMEKALVFMEESVQQDEPFFSVIWFHTPHLPVVATDQQRAAYPGLSLQEQLYFATISNLDRAVTQLSDFLKEQKITDNTLIFFCSDNGPENRTPGSSGSFRGRKRDLYEGGLRVPAFCVWPEKLKNKQSIDFPSFTSDYLPTIAAFLNIELPADLQLDGISLKEALMLKDKERVKAMGFLYPKKQSWVTHEYKLISTDQGVTYELYNLLDDPAESTNVMDQNPEKGKTLQRELEDWINSVKPK